MYNVGDKLVHPMHGAGVVEAVEEKNILDEKKFYYVMRMPVGDVKVMIPVDSTESVGVRNVIDSVEAENVMKAFSDYSADLSTNWNKRYRDNMEKMKHGDILDIAYVVKTLMLKEKTKGLSMGERKMLNSARQILISEMVIAKNSTIDEIDECLNNIVSEELQSEEDKIVEGVDIA
ncbi:MAG: CarD family transcriptional regulator [Clostridiales bacterium]|jgi:CarD family transcriptional regulator|nr:CarD family transcriptional regulator [Clostridiales bacterium]